VAEPLVRLAPIVRAIEALAQAGWAVRDLRDGRSDCSEGFRAILGRGPEGPPPTEADVLAQVHPADREAVAALLAGAVASGRAVERDFRIVRPDGSERRVFGRAVIVVDAAGRPLRLEAVLKDLTDRHRLEEELDGLIRELLRSNEELEQFSYVASHDLRQPLRVVGSYVSLLEEDLHAQLSGEAVEYMALVRDGVRRMDRLITDLLAYSRVGRVSEDRPVAVSRVIDTVLADLQFEIDETGATIAVETRLPTVMGDPSEVERLFQNLLGNALKYRAPQRPPRVRVRCEDHDGHWRFVVADNGIGIPPEHAERVFGIFQRLHARDAYEGTGVGLAIVRKIVDRQGGAIRVEPSVEGATLAFTWPKRTLSPPAVLVEAAR